MAAFFAAREMTIAVFLRVTGGAAGARDMAFVLRTAVAAAAAASSEVEGATVQSAIAVEEDSPHPSPHVPGGAISNKYDKDDDGEDEAYAPPVSAARPHRRPRAVASRTASPAGVLSRTDPGMRVGGDTGAAAYSAAAIATTAAIPRSLPRVGN